MRIPGPWSDHYMPLFFIGRYLFCCFVAYGVDDGMSYTLSGLSLERSITCAVGDARSAE